MGRKRRCWTGRGAWLGAAFLGAASLAHDTYQEELHLSRVGRTGRSLSAQFVFELDFEIEARHVCAGGVVCAFDAFPAGLGTLIDELGVQELGLSLTNSWWDARQWGRLPVGAYHPRGLEIWARMDETVPAGSGVADRWKALLQGLGGLYRVQASLLAQQTVLQPDLLSESFGSAPQAGQPWGRGRLFHGVLSREAPCVDNLEPFLRTLPCRDRHGLAAFLRQPSVLLDGDHLGLSLHARRYCRGNATAEGSCASPSLHLQRVVTVLRRAIDGQSDDAVAWAPLLQPPVPAATACPLASTSTLHLHPDAGPWSPPDWLRVAAPPAAASSSSSRALLVVSRSKGQQDLTRGVLRLWLDSKDTDLAVQVLERVPYFIEPLLHLWTVELTTTNTTASSPRRVDDLGRDSFEWRAAEPGSKGDSVLEYGFRLAAGEEALITMPFLTRFLHFEDFPANPMRGLEVPAVIITARPLSPGGGEAVSSVERYSSEALLIDLPTPDFSMPFNVITLSSTLVAFFFGTMINILVKKSGGDKTAVAEKAAEGARSSFLVRLRSMLSRRPREAPVPTS